MRILVGTLYTIENEFEECVSSIRRQTYPNFKHIVIKNLPLKEAHDTLYQTFVDRSDEFDLLIKVDADMVVPDEEFFTKIVSKFRQNEWLELLQVHCYDYFSDRLIAGLNTYRNSMRWEKTEESTVFVDYVNVPDERCFIDKTELAPAAIHCKNPSLFQAFHYGIHKAIKVRSAIEMHRSGPMVSHWNNIELTWRHFLRSGDVRLGLAVLGAELTLQGRFLPEHVDYTNPFALEALSEFESCDAEQIRSLVKGLRWSNFGFLPSRIRREAMGVRDRGISYMVRRITAGR